MLAEKKSSVQSMNDNVTQHASRSKCSQQLSIIIKLTISKLFCSQATEDKHKPYYYEFGPPTRVEDQKKENLRRKLTIFFTAKLTNVSCKLVLHVGCERLVLTAVKLYSGLIC